MRTRKFLKKHLSLCITLSAIALICLLFQVTGLRLCAVQSGSMEPNIPTYSMCLVSTHASYDELLVGDIVVYEHAYDGIQVIHRVYEIRDDGIVTKGDANNATDGISVTPENLYGKYIAHVPYLAYVFNFVRSPIGIVVILLLIGAVFMLDEFGTKRKRQ